MSAHAEQMESPEGMDESPTFHLDPSEVGGNYEPGDTLPVKCVGKTSDGMLVCKCEHEEKGEDMGWEKDFDQHMTPPEESPATDGGGAEQVT